MPLGPQKISSQLPLDKLVIICYDYSVVTNMVAWLSW